MPAVMENDENACEESCGGNSKHQRDPLRGVPRQNHEAPESEIRNNGVHKLPDAAPQDRFLMFGNHGLPGEPYRRGFVIHLWQFSPARRAVQPPDGMHYSPPLAKMEWIPQIQKRTFSVYLNGPTLADPLLP